MAPRGGPKTRQTILDEALRLFVEQGFTETTTRDIADASGISEGAIYRHFKSKDEIGWELFHDSYAVMADRLGELVEAAPDFAGAMQAIIADLCRLFDDEPFRFRYLLLAQHNFLHRVTAKMKSPIKVLRGLIERGIAEGAVGVKDAALATSFAQGPLLFTAQSVVYRTVKPPLARLADEIYGATMRAIDAQA
ncbi:MAG: TetR/AcrR family transcriptional regulator [Rhodospirillaceae bacterium]|nr:TetR/AcrR family transcriptional regulator [Rhodospirillaceae bacterium]